MDACSLLILCGAQTAVRYQSRSQTKSLAQRDIIQYLLKQAWDIENSNNLQRLIWGHIITSNSKALEQFEGRYEISKKVLELGQNFDDGFFETLCDYGILGSGLLSKQIDSQALRKYLRFFISNGMDLEEADSLFDETPLLYVARIHTKPSVMWLRAILEHGANLTATNYAGKGALHLVFGQWIDSSWMPNGDKTRLLHTKLVLLLRAGCSVTAIDLDGRTPDYYAKTRGKEDVWMSALQEVGISDGQVVESSPKQRRQSRHYGSFKNLPSPAPLGLMSSTKEYCQYQALSWSLNFPHDVDDMMDHIKASPHFQETNHSVDIVA